MSLLGPRLLNHAMHAHALTKSLSRLSLTSRPLSSLPSHLPQNLNLDPQTLRLLTKPPPPPEDDPKIQIAKGDVWGATKCKLFLEKYNVKEVRRVKPQSSIYKIK